jgi:hypothetical protein
MSYCPVCSETVLSIGGSFGFPLFIFSLLYLLEIDNRSLAVFEGLVDDLGATTKIDFACG